MKRVCAASLSLTFIVILCNLAYAEMRLYRERAGDREFVNMYHIESNGNGYRVIVETRNNTTLHIRKELWLDASFSTLKWQYLHVKDDIDIIAYREENTIRLFGIHKGKPIEKIFKIDEDPWKQQFPMDFEKFVLSQKDSIKFWAIGTDGPAAMKAAKFVASKKERVHVTVNGEKTETVRVRVSITGLLSFLWYGNSWHRLTDGQYIRFKSVGAPGHPPTILEIVSDNKISNF